VFVRVFGVPRREVPPLRETQLHYLALEAWLAVALLEFGPVGDSGPTPGPLPETGSTMLPTWKQQGAGWNHGDKRKAAETAWRERLAVTNAQSVERPHRILFRAQPRARHGDTPSSNPDEYRVQTVLRELCKRPILKAVDVEKEIVWELVSDEETRIVREALSEEKPGELRVHLWAAWSILNTLAAKRDAAPPRNLPDKLPDNVPNASTSNASNQCELVD